MRTAKGVTGRRDGHLALTVKARTMDMTIPPTDTQKNIEAIKRAANMKRQEVEAAQRKLAELQAEFRGLCIALDALEGKPTPRALGE